jgi:hypothetical protein
MKLTVVLLKILVFPIFRFLRYFAKFYLKKRKKVFFGMEAKLEDLERLSVLGKEVSH